MRGCDLAMASRTIGPAPLLQTRRGGTQQPGAPLQETGTRKQRRQKLSKYQKRRTPALGVPYSGHQRRQKQQRILLGLAGLVSASLVSSLAAAYRSNEELISLGTSEPAVWPLGVYAYELALSSPDGLELDAVAEAIHGGLSTWQKPECTTWTVQFLGTTPWPAAPEDGRNTVQWVYENWAAISSDATAASVTDAIYERADDGTWLILEADVYLNGEHFLWTSETSGEGDKREVRSVMLHEGGHVLGLLHPCEVVETPDVPSCDTSNEYSELAMHPVYSSSLDELADDDMAGVCALYPAAEGAPSVSEEGAGGGPSDSGNTTESGGFIGTRCADDADCAAGLSCVLSRCTVGEGLVGDPCEGGADCRSTACSGDGYCARACATEDDCIDLPAGACVQAEEGPAYCVSELGPFDHACGAGSECESGLCLTNEEASGRCSRACALVGSLACPEGWACEDVDGGPLCVPVSQEKGCDCAVTRKPPQFAWAAVGAVAAAIMLRNLRRRRAAETLSSQR